MADIAGRESPEMYLKAIYLENKEKGSCRSVDVANRLGFSKPSVSVAINNLQKEGFLEIGDGGMITLTDKGQERAQMVYDKYCFWIDVLEKYGLDPEEAENEACEIEHALSDEAFLQIRQAIQRKDT